MINFAPFLWHPPVWVVWEYVIHQDYFPCNVAIAAIAVKWNYCIKFHEITLRPNQGGVNSINLKRIFKIGREALGDFRRINRNIKKKNS